MRPTTGIGLAGLAIIGIILADILIHPEGTKAAANGIVSIIKPTESALLGVAPQ